MVECDFCGCHSPKHEKGWVAYPDDDVTGAPGILIYCPPCAFGVLGYLLEAAVEHVCNFERQPSASDTS